MVAVALARQGDHEVLVVPVAEADGRDRDPLLGERPAEIAEIPGAARTDVREAVRNEDDAVHAMPLDELLHLPRALADAGEEGGVAGRVEALDLLVDLLAVAHLGRRDEHVDGVVVSDDGDDIVRAEPVDREQRGLLGLADLLAGHRAGPIEDDRDVRRRPSPGSHQREPGEGHLDVRPLCGAAEHYRVAHGNVETDLIRCDDLRREDRGRGERDRREMASCVVHGSLPFCLPPLATASLPAIGDTVRGGNAGRAPVKGL